MSRSLFSPLWYRVARQSPRLDTDVRVERQRSRDELWYVLRDPVSGRHFRVNEHAYQFVGRCDGARTVQAIWDDLLDRLGDDAPTQDEVIVLLDRLDESGLIVTDVALEPATAVRRAKRQSKRRKRVFVNPFAFRIALGDPWRLLDRIGPYFSWLFHPVILVVWGVVVLVACVMAAANWGALTGHARAYVGSPSFLLLTWLSFPVIKALHEMCHALAVRHWGGEVHETGITLFALMPSPYMDASAAAAFGPRHQRVAVGAAGVMCELFIAAVAVMVWLAVEPGLFRDVAFVCMFTGSVSTLAFNGNPLLKFDTYYVLCDLLELPNLASRSAGWWSARIKRMLAGSPMQAQSPLAAGEAKWLVLYAPASALYRVGLSIAMVLWIGAESALIGVLAATYLFALGAVLPAIKWCRELLAGAASMKMAWRARTALGVCAVALIMLIAVIPLPWHTVAQGLVWMPEQARVRPEVDGFVSAILVGDGERIEAGTPILRLEDPTLLAEQSRLAQRTLELEADRFNAFVARDLARVGNAEEELHRNSEALARIDEKIAQLQVRSRVAGVLAMPRQKDLLGGYVRRGDNLGFVLDGRETIVRAAIAEEDVALVRDRTDAVGVRVAGAYQREIAARLVRDMPAATHELPSAALGIPGGGVHAVDPNDRNGVTTSEPVVLIDLRLPAMSLERVGARAWVRFEHRAEPLAGQLYWRARQLFLRHFNPGGT